MPMSNKVAIKYRDFYDVPRIFLTSHEGVHFLFDCKFDDALDEYPNSYKVYLMPPLSDSDLSGSWDGLPKLAIRYVGEVPLSDVKFDRTLRSEIDTKVIEDLLGTHVS
jgi:hypothetical protein